MKQKKVSCHRNSTNAKRESTYIGYVALIPAVLSAAAYLSVHAIGTNSALENILLDHFSNNTKIIEDYVYLKNNANAFSSTTFLICRIAWKVYFPIGISVSIYLAYRNDINIKNIYISVFAVVFILLELYFIYSDVQIFNIKTRRGFVFPNYFGLLLISTGIGLGPILAFHFLTGRVKGR